MIKKFNKKIVANQTKVRLINDENWYLVKEVHESRNWIKIYDVCGSFQRDDIEKFTNKDFKDFDAHNIWDMLHEKMYLSSSEENDSFWKCCDDAASLNDTFTEALADAAKWRGEEI